jgi:hypothetical protein
MRSKRERSKFQLRGFFGHYQIVEETQPNWPGEVLQTFESTDEAQRAIRKLRADERRRLRLLREPDAVKRFLGLHCFHAEGQKVRFTRLWERFLRTEPSGLWTKQRLRKSLPKLYPAGKSTGGQLWVGNISFREPGPDEPRTPRLARVGNGLLRPVDVFRPSNRI